LIRERVVGGPWGHDGNAEVDEGALVDRRDQSAHAAEVRVKGGRRDAHITGDRPRLEDILAMGLANRSFAIPHPNEYKLLFSRQVVRYARGVRAEVDSSMNADAPAGIAAFAMVVERARAILKADLIDPMDASLFSAQMWAALHGYVALELGGHFGQKPDLLVMGGLFGALLKGYGATEEDIMRALLSSSERVHLVRRPPLES